jgi:glycogen operon protein
MNDLVSYIDKHNELNGEGNRDGDNNNHSMNYGVEGPTKRSRIDRDRRKTIKCYLASLLLSQGVPMIVSGDECRRTQRGNNNAYCQDNDVSWFDWTLVKKNEDLVRFTRELIAFRRKQPTVRRKTFLSGEYINGSPIPDVSWFGPAGTPVEWNGSDLALVAVLAKPGAEEDPQDRGRDLLLMFNANYQPRRFLLPPVVHERRWKLFLDTAADTPKDVYPKYDGPAPPASGVLELDGKSVRVYVADEK